MSPLDSPLEVLAFNHLSSRFLTAANNVWAWIAVVTAAISVWTIRALSPRGRSLNRESSLSSPCFSTPTTAAAPSSSEVKRVAATELTSEAEVSVPSTSAISAFHTEGKTSGKFAVYYCDDNLVDEDEDKYNCGNCESNDDIDALEQRSSSAEWLGNYCWEVMRMKMSVNDMEWYHYQDLAVLDGNVVRLWDDCRRRSAALYHCQEAAHGGDGAI